MQWPLVFISNATLLKNYDLHINKSPSYVHLGRLSSKASHVLTRFNITIMPITREQRMSECFVHSRFQTDRAHKNKALLDHVIPFYLSRSSWWDLIHQSRAGLVMSYTSLSANMTSHVSRLHTWHVRPLNQTDSQMVFLRHRALI